MSLWGHTGRRSDRRVLNRRRGRPGPRLAVRRGAVGVGVVQGPGPIGAREGLAGSRRGYGAGGFRSEISADAYSRGAGRRTRHGVTQLEIAVNVRTRTASWSPTQRPTQLDVTAGTLSRTPDQASRRRPLQLEVTPTGSHFTAQPVNRCPQLEVPVTDSRTRRPQREVPVGIPDMPGTLGIGTGIPVDASPTDMDPGIPQRPRRSTLRLSRTRYRNNRHRRAPPPSPPLRPRRPPLRRPLVHGSRPPTTARATPYSPDSTRFAGRGAEAGQWSGWAGNEGVEEGDEVASGAGARSRPGAMTSGAVDHDVRATGGVALSGRIRGDMTAAPAITGAVNVCRTSSPWTAEGDGTPGSSGAETEVGTAVSPSIDRWVVPWASRGPTPRRRPASVVAAPVPCVRAGVTPVPPRASAAVSPGATVATPPSAIAASETAPAATNANRIPREAERSVSCRLTSWIRKPSRAADRDGDEGVRTVAACGPAGT